MLFGKGERVIYSVGSVKGKIKLKCEDCGEIREVNRNTAIIEKKEHPCRKCSNKRNGLKKIGRPSWNSGRRLPQHQRQIGNKYICHHGYVLVYMADDSIKYGRNDQYVLEHRKVMQDLLGRPLGKKEIIHHIDGDKANNSSENLYLCSCMSHHRDVHNGLEELAFELFKAGLIEFDRENGVYKMAPLLSNGKMEPREFRGRLRPDKV